MSIDYFLDTNVLVYSFDASAPAKADKARLLIEKSLGEGRGAISWQVMQEFCNLALRKFASPMTAPECGLYLRKVLLPLCRVWPSEALYLDALELVRETAYSYYDCLILAAALESGASMLLTEDLQNGRKLRSLEIVNPFA
jgi:predicted nucleic acid-binding protein